MQKSRGISDDVPNATGAQGVNPTQFLALIDLSVLVEKYVLSVVDLGKRDTRVEKTKSTLLK